MVPEIKFRHSIYKRKYGNSSKIKKCSSVDICDFEKSIGEIIKIFKTSQK